MTSVNPWVGRVVKNTSSVHVYTPAVDEDNGWEIDFTFWQKQLFIRISFCYEMNTNQRKIEDSQ